MQRTLPTRHTIEFMHSFMKSFLASCSPLWKNHVINLQKYMYRHIWLSENVHIVGKSLHRYCKRWFFSVFKLTLRRPGHGWESSDNVSRLGSDTGLVIRQSLPTSSVHDRHRRINSTAEVNGVFGRLSQRLQRRENGSVSTSIAVSWGIHCENW